MCLVMEHLEGETLRTLLERVKQLPMLDALEIARQISVGLVRAHGLGVVHRDLKPENVMLTHLAQGKRRIKILDFGMARLLTGGPGTPLTRKGAVFGTPEYMAPEQAMGQPVDESADQYAFGVMVFEMLAGGRPFSAKSPLEMLQKHIREAPPKIRSVAPNLPPTVEATVERMMAKKPAERFPNVAAAAEALAAHAS
jgi:serine/threonine-protein kinase